MKYVLLIHEVRVDSETWVEGPFTAAEAEVRMRELDNEKTLHTVIRYPFRQVDLPEIPR